MSRRLPRSFYDRPCLTVAEDLLGKYLCRRIGGRTLVGRIAETEAYIGQEDRACHASRGPTPRAKILFGPPGISYVYLIYGVYHCFNAVCEANGRAAAVLVRALEPVEGIADRTDGPGKLCDTLRITRDHNGLDLSGRGSALWIEDRGDRPIEAVATPRIGVDYAGEWAMKPWRLVDPASAHLSRKLLPNPISTPKRRKPHAI